MRSVALAAGILPRESSKFCPLEVSATTTNFSQVIQNIMSRMNRAVPLPFSVQAGTSSGRAGVKFRCLARLGVMLLRHTKP
jgi:hypothetical protein